MYSTKNDTIFVKPFVMRGEDVRIMGLTEAEADLIEAARNYVRSYPDGHPELLWYAQELFDEIVEVF